jgi:hypothetical protein
MHALAAFAFSPFFAISARSLAYLVPLASWSRLFLWKGTAVTIVPSHTTVLAEVHVPC